MSSSIADLLANLPATSSLSEDDRGKLAALATAEELAPGAVLFEEGQPSARLWIVAEGRIGLSMRCPGHPETTVLTVGRGELLGWSALTPEARRVATGRAVERATLVGFERGAVLALCEQDHDIGFALMKLAFLEVSRRLHDTRLQLLDLFGEPPCR